MIFPLFSGSTIVVSKASCFYKVTKCSLNIKTSFPFCAKDNKRVKIVLPLSGKFQIFSLVEAVHVRHATQGHGKLLKNTWYLKSHLKDILQAHLFFNWSMTCSLADIKFNWKTKWLYKSTKGYYIIDLVVVESQEEQVDYWMRFHLKPSVHRMRP